MESEEFQMGRAAYLRGESLESNPYIVDNKWARGSYEDWERGWWSAKEEAQPDVSTQPSQEREYLGDGLYVEFDGYQLKLSASNGMFDHDTVYLEPGVLRALIAYIKRTPGLSDEVRDEIRRP